MNVYSSVHNWESLFWEMGLLVALISFTPLGVSMALGLLLGILQAATQVQEQSLSFVAKIASVATVFYLLGPWFSEQLLLFCQQVFDEARLLAAQP